VAAATAAEQNDNSTDSKKHTALTASVPLVSDISDPTIRNVITGHGTDFASVLNQMSAKTSTVNGNSSEKEINSVASDAAARTPILNIKMSPNEIRKWKESYSEEKLKVYLMGKSRDRSQQMNAFGTLAKLMMASQTVEDFNGERNNLYRWQARYTLDLEAGEGRTYNQLHKKNG
jgi:hypothetical protein